MPGKPAIDKFYTDWNQTASWAQSKGIKYNDYLPIYQQDSQNLLASKSVMSQAERERAVVAAADVGKPTQTTPSTAARPGNVVGNTITDLRNIFTGIGDIAIHPLHNGLVDSIKNTFDILDMHNKQRGMSVGAMIGQDLTSTVLGWVPGAADIGTVLSKEYGPNNHNGWRGASGNPGLDALAEHPVSSILDVLPLAKPLTLARDASDAGIAARVTGATGQEALAKAQNLTIGRVVKGYIMNTATKDRGPLPNGEFGNLTIGDKIHNAMGAGKLNVNPVIRDTVGGIDTTLDTQMERSIFDNSEHAMDAIKDQPEKMAQLDDILNGRHENNLEDRMRDPQYDPAVKKTAWALLQGPIRFMREMSLVTKNGLSIVTDPLTGDKRLYAVVAHKNVIKTRDAHLKDTQELLKDENFPQLLKWQDQWEKAQTLHNDALDKLQEAQSALREVKRPADEMVTWTSHGDKRPVGQSHNRSITKLGDFIQSVIDRGKQGRYEDLVELSKAALNKLDKWGADEVDASADPVFQALQKQLLTTYKTAVMLRHINTEATRAAHGAADEWTGDTPYRDQLHKDEANAAKAQQRSELRRFARHSRDVYAQVRRAYGIKKDEIRARYAKAKMERDAYVADKTREINERYGIEKAKVTTRHMLAREAHIEWQRGRRAQGLEAPQEYIAGAEAGTRMHPGQLGSPEAIAAGHATLEAARLTELRDLEASVPTRAKLESDRLGELGQADLKHAQMREQLAKQFTKDVQTIHDRHASEDKLLRKQHKGMRKREGKISDRIAAYNKSRKAFAKALWDHPSDNFTPLYFNLFAKNLLENEDAKVAIQSTMRDRYDWDEEKVASMRSNPQTMAQLTQLAIQGAFDSPLFDAIDPKIIKDASDSAYKQLNELSAQGIFPQYIPNIELSSARDHGSYGVRIIVGKGMPKPDALNPRMWGMESSKFDLMAGLHRGVKQILDIAATRDYIETYLDPHIVTAKQAMEEVLLHSGEDVSTLDEEAVTHLVKQKMEEWNLVKFDPMGKFGFTTPRWGNGAVYIDKDLARAVEKITADGLPTKGVFEKATKLFRYSILGLSPRYTAHIVFGGTFLLLLRSSPLVFMVINDAHKMVKEGRSPDGLQTGPTQMGTVDYQFSSTPKTPRKSPDQEVMDEWGRRAGVQSVRMMAHEHIEKVQGVARGAAKPIHYLRALADLNLHFTSYVTHMQRAVAYLDGMAAAGRRGIIDENGERVAMTKERMELEGQHHAREVMGDLRRMSPFERQVAKSAMPFYGWQKHILQYVLSYPGDHPWRAMMLSQMAEEDTANSPGGLPSRYQFLFYLGSPDAQGNVTAVDARAANPLRDVANYATPGGIISSLNPVLTAGFSYVDPQIIYGSNDLYPNVTYDQFYGIENAGPQGNVLQAASQIVPQIGALQTAFKDRAALSQGNTIKNVAEQLNIPWVPQHLNLKEEAAKQATTQYQVATTLTKHAWDTGDFSAIQDLGTVPDPRNPDYQTPVSELEQLYAQLAKEYPGVPPRDSVASLPSLHL